MLDDDRSPNAVSVHAGTSQMDFEVDCPPPARSTRRSFYHPSKGNGNFVSKRVSKNEKIVVSVIDLKEMKTRNDCEIACDCVKRANVVLHVGLCEEIFARKHTATHKPTSHGRSRVEKKFCAILQGGPGGGPSLCMQLMIRA